MRLTARTVEVFLKGERIAAHLRGSGNGRNTSIADHMPSSHRRYADWTAERLLDEAGRLGPSVTLLCEKNSLRPATSRTWLSLVPRHPAAGATSWCCPPRRGRAARAGDRRALEIGARNYGAVRSILEKKLDGVPVPQPRSAGEVGVDHPNIIGKSWLACAIGHKACRDNRAVLYARFPRLLEELALARGDGRIASRLKSLAQVELLILDDWGLQPLDAQARHDLLEILEDRYGRKSTIVTSQLPVASWHHAIGDATYADAILDRLFITPTASSSMATACAAQNQPSRLDRHTAR